MNRVEKAKAFWSVYLVDELSPQLGPGSIKAPLENAAAMAMHGNLVTGVNQREVLRQGAGFRK